MTSDRTILIADDNADDVLLMRWALRKAGLDNPVAVAQDGKQAIDYLQGEGRFHDREQYPFPCMLLLDVRLPRMDGYDVLNWIREQPELHDFPVIVLSGSESERQIRKVYDLGAKIFIEKPLAFADLVDLVRTRLSNWLSPVPAAA